jgi:hypothetical protein
MAPPDLAQDIAYCAQAWHGARVIPFADQETTVGQFHQPAAAQRGLGFQRGQRFTVSVVYGKMSLLILDLYFGGTVRAVPFVICGRDRPRPVGVE